MKNEYAFPFLESFDNGTFGGAKVESNQGLLTREYFAVKILAALISGYPNGSKVNERFIASSEYPELCKQAIQITDELINQLDKK